jgi:hypothetical protein
MIRRTEGPVIPLEHCVPYVIEFDGVNYTKKMIRDGYRLPALIKLGSVDDFEISIDPADGYVTDSTAGNVDPYGPNSIRVTLQGTSTRPRYNA